VPGGAAEVNPVNSLPADGEPLTSLLLPGNADPALDNLAFSTFTDGTVPVPVSPVDQLLVSLTRRVVREAALGGVAIVQVPRARHRIALTLAICMHLLRKQERLLSGPVVLAALDVDLTAQLRQLSMQNRSRVSLGRDNPLSAQRLTGTGAVAPLLGGAPVPVDGSFIYYNTRIGSPPLRSGPPLVVIDATSLTTADRRSRPRSRDLGLATRIVGGGADERASAGRTRVHAR
jgi:hypothetical protein